MTNQEVEDKLSEILKIMRIMQEEITMVQQQVTALTGMLTAECTERWHQARKRTPGIIDATGSVSHLTLRSLR